MEHQVLDQLLTCGILAIVRGVPSHRMAELAAALEAGGVRCMEVTFDQSNPEKAWDTMKAIHSIREAMGDRMCVGAGTVMTVEQVRQAAQAGAEYMVAPNTDRAVIEAAKALGKYSIPGAMTPTEIAQAHQYGADIVKLFPAGLLGPDYVKAVKAPLKHIPLMAVGNITLDNCAALRRAGAVGVGVSSGLFTPELVEAGRFDAITAAARAYQQAWQG